MNVSGSHRRHTTKPVKKRLSKYLVQTESTNVYRLIGPVQGSSVHSPSQLSLNVLFQCAFCIIVCGCSLNMGLLTAYLCVCQCHLLM